MKQIFFRPANIFKIYNVALLLKCLETLGVDDAIQQIICYVTGSDLLHIADEPKKGVKFIVFGQNSSQ